MFGNEIYQVSGLRGKGLDERTFFYLFYLPHSRHVSSNGLMEAEVLALRISWICALSDIVVFLSVVQVKGVGRI
jgi:hypothetical protein